MEERIVSATCRNGLVFCSVRQLELATKWNKCSNNICRICWNNVAELRSKHLTTPRFQYKESVDFFLDQTLGSHFLKLSFPSGIPETSKAIVGSKAQLRTTTPRTRPFESIWEGKMRAQKLHIKPPRALCISFLWKLCSIFLILLMAIHWTFFSLRIGSFNQQWLWAYIHWLSKLSHCIVLSRNGSCVPLTVTEDMQ